MSSRNVLVTLRAEVTGFQAGMAAAASSTQVTEASLQRLAASGDTAMGRMTYSASEHSKAWRDAGLATLGFGVAVAAGIGYAVKEYADFNQQMALVQTLSHANAEEMGQLTDAALHMGQGIGYTANEVADAEAELIKAGISVKDIMGGALVGALDLASAGQMDVAGATEIAAEAMTQFGLKGSDVPHIADLLAAGADKALGSVSDLGWALTTGGLVAHQFGLSIEDTVGTLALFAQNGLKGEAAGTDLRQMLIKLAAPSKQSTADMEKLGMVLYDSQGHFVGITALAGQLHDKMQGLSEAERNAMMAHIFGARSIVGANILYQAGAKGVQDWINKVNDSGFAVLQATGKMNSMNGDLKKLQAAWQTSMIDMGSASDSFVRPVIQGVTTVVQWFDKLPQPLKGALLGFGAAAGAAALLGGSFLMLAPKVLDTINGFKQLANDVPGLTGKLGALGKAAGVAAIALIGFEVFNALAYQQHSQSIDQITNSIIAMTRAGNSGGIKNLDAQMSDFGTMLGRKIGPDINSTADAIARITHPQGGDGINRWADQAFGWTGLVKSETTQVDEHLQKVGETLANLVSSGGAPTAAKAFNQLSAEFVKNGSSAQDALNHMPAYRDSLLAQAHAANVSLSATDLLNYAAGKIPPAMAAAAASYGTYKDALGNAQPVTADMSKALAAVGLAADGTVLSMDKLIGSMEQAGLVQLSADSAAIAYHKALDDLSASIKTNGHTLDINTAAGRANRTALDAIASSGLQVVQANAKNGDSQQSLTRNMRTTYDALVAGAGQFGITGAAADTLARKALGIPKGVKIESAIQNYIDSMLKLEGISAEADRVNGKSVDIWVTTHNDSIYSEEHVSTGQGGSGGQTKAEGGLIHLAAGGAVNHLAGGGSPHWMDMRPHGTDTIPAMLTPGEFVVNAGQTAKNLPYLEAVNAGANFTPAMYMPRPEYGGGGGGPQMVTVNMMLDGKVIDSKIINLSQRVAGAAVDSFARDIRNRR